MRERGRNLLFLVFFSAVLASCSDINPEVTCIASCNEAKTFEYSLNDGSLNFKGIFLQNSEVRLFEDGVEVPVQSTFGANTLKIVPIANAPHQLKPASMYKLMITSANANGTSTFTLPASTSGSTLSGDVSGDTSTTSVDKIKGIPVSATAPTSGSFLKYNGTSWDGSSLSTSDITGLPTSLTSINSSLSSKIDQSQLPSSCGAGSTLTFSSVTGTFTCSSIAISDSQITFSSKTANTFLAAPASANGAPTFRALTLADMPSGMSASQWTTNGSNISYSAGAVGIGTTSPSGTLHVSSATGEIANFESSVTSSTSTFAGIKISSQGSSRGIIGYGGPGGIFTNALTSSLQIKSSGPIQMGAGSTASIYIDASGNFGIGSTTPSKPLTVAGEALIGGLTIGRGGSVASTRNTAIGNNALYSATATGIDNTALGYKALYANTDGFSNTGLGSEALLNNTTGNGNTGIGFESLYLNSTGSGNVGIGYQSLMNLSGSNNIAIGASAGSQLTTQSGVVILGGHSGSGLSSGMIVLANGNGVERMRVDATGLVGIGTSTPAHPLDVVGTINATGVMYGQNFITNSDIRYKRDVASISNPLVKVLALNGVTYDWRKDEFPEKHFSDRHQIGLIAQDVEKQFPEAVWTDEKGFKSVAYATLVAPIIEAIKELSSTKADKAEIEKLKSENAELKARLDRLEKSILKN